jgi:hypothetical protein
MTSSPPQNESRQPSPSIGTARVARPSPVPASRLGTLIRATVRLRLTLAEPKREVAPLLTLLSFPKTCPLDPASAFISGR